MVTFIQSRKTLWKNSIVIVHIRVFLHGRRESTTTAEKTAEKAIRYYQKNNRVYTTFPQRMENALSFRGRFIFLIYYDLSKFLMFSRVSMSWGSLVIAFFIFSMALQNVSQGRRPCSSQPPLIKTPWFPFSARRRHSSTRR